MAPWWLILIFQVMAMDCDDRVFRHLGVGDRLLPPEGFTRTATGESASERPVEGLESSYTPETLRSLQEFLSQGGIPLAPGPEALKDSAEHHTRWKADVDAFLAGAERDQGAKLRSQLESIYLDYLAHPSEHGDVKWLPGLDAETPLNAQPLAQLFRDPASVRAHGIVERTLRNSAEGFESLLEAPARDLNKRFRHVSVVRVNYLMVRIFQKVQQYHSAP